MYMKRQGEAVLCVYTHVYVYKKHVKEYLASICVYSHVYVYRCIHIHTVNSLYNNYLIIILKTIF